MLPIKYTKPRALAFCVGMGIVAVGIELLWEHLFHGWGWVCGVLIVVLVTVTNQYTDKIFQR